VSAVGRRPGNADTRGEIVEAAKRVFADKGYEGTSLRAVAREAAVDPALVHHYFDGKASLFVAAMALPFDPRQVKEHAAGAEYSGSRTIEGFLTMWDLAEGTGSSFASCLSAMAASTNVADAMREFVNERVWSVVQHKDGETETVRRRRTAMVSSQLMGLAFARYILRVPPMSTASPKQIGRWVGPTLDRYVKEAITS
jgi:AcrR family transcriptional regulator